MLPPVRPHAEYVRFVQEQLATRNVEVPDHLRKILPLFLWFDWTPLRPLVEPLYSLCLGRKACPPEDLFRSFMLMAFCQAKSISHWVPMMRDHPAYAIVSGFAPEALPAVGTFYTFMDRLLRRTQKGRSQLRKKVDKAQQKAPPAASEAERQDGIIRRLAARILEAYRDQKPRKHTDRVHFTEVGFRRYERTLQQIFSLLFVQQSVERGLLDLLNLVVSGDSTNLATWASPHGRKVCACEDRCECARAFRDGEATWGFDAAHDTYVYGHGLSELKAARADQPGDLPVFLTLEDCQRHDGGVSLRVMPRAIDILGLPLRVASFDAASDNWGFYQLGQELWDVALVIPLNPRNQKEVPERENLDEQGRPMCQAGYPMTYWGFCPDRVRLKWRCPRAGSARFAQEHPETPGGPCPCSASSSGRVVYTYPKENYRLYTRIPRGSATWEQYRHQQSGSERSHKAKKYDFGLKGFRIAGRERWFFLAMMAAMDQHLRAWGQQEGLYPAATG